MTTTVQNSAPGVPNAVPLTRRFKSGCIGFMAFYGLAASLILALWLTIGERAFFVSLLISFLHVVMMPSLIFLPLLLILKRWRLSLLTLPPFAAFIILYSPVFLPRSVAIPPDALQLHLLTYNMHAEEKILDPMLANIREANADIVAVQEMSAPMGAALDSRLTDLYPYRALYPIPDNSYHGRALLSKYPILENRIWPVSYPLPVRLQRVVVDVNGTPITIYNFHAPPSQPIYGQGFNFQPRLEQVQSVLTMIAGESNPVLLMCDCNTYDLDQNYRSITAVLHDTYREVGWGMGFTNPDWSTPQGREGLPFIPPHQRPDYIFHDDHFLPVESRVWSNSGGSDHRPVYATLALKP